MKIAIVVGVLNMGGLEKVTINIANELSKQHDVEMIVIKENQKYYPLATNIKVIEGRVKYNIFEKIFRRLNLAVMKQQRFGYFKENYFVKKVLHHNDYDVVIATDGAHTMITANALKVMDKDKKPKFVSWLHNDFNTYYYKYYKTYQTEFAKSLGIADQVVTLSNDDCRDYSQFNSNTVTIYNPLTIKHTEISNLKNSEVIFVGRLIREQKGLDFLLDIAQHLKNSEIKIRVVGDGQDKAWLEQEIERRQLQDIIILHGSVKKNIEKLYANASLFISTSRWEGFGLVVTEAMACGLPIISFDNSGPKEILEGGKYGILIPKYNIKQFAHEILEMMGTLEKSQL